MNCLPDTVHLPFKNQFAGRNEMKEPQTDTIFKSYSEGIHSVRELERENHISSDDSKLLTEILSSLYVSARLNSILGNFSIRVEKKLMASLDNMIEKWWTYNDE